MEKCRNIYFQLVDVDRSLGGASSYGVVMRGCSYCGLQYSRVYVGGIAAAATGWVYNVNFAIEVQYADGGATPNDHISIYGNAISGVCGKMIYCNAMSVKTLVATSSTLVGLTVLPLITIGDREPTTRRMTLLLVAGTITTFSRSMAPLTT
jgi:hypothetical protein